MQDSVLKHLVMLLLVLGLVSACANDNRAVRKSTSPADLRSASAVNVQLAVGYIKRQQYDVAKIKLDKAIEQDSDNIEAYKMMAFLMTVVGKPEEAEDYYQDAIDINDEDPEVRNSYGTYLCQLGRFDDAQEEFKLAYSNPYYKTAYLAYSNAGTCLIKQQKYTEAEQLLRKALQSQPKHPGALLSMAEVGVKSNKHLMSRAYIQRYHIDNEPTAESLWLQMQAEKALGATKYYEAAGRKLLELFPDSDQAGLVDQSLRYESR